MQSVSLYVRRLLLFFPNRFLLCCYCNFFSFVFWFVCLHFAHLFVKEQEHALRTFVPQSDWYDNISENEITTTTTTTKRKQCEFVFTIHTNTALNCIFMCAHCVCVHELVKCAHTHTMYAQTTFLWPRNIVSSFCNRFVWQYVHIVHQQQYNNSTPLQIHNSHFVNFAHSRRLRRRCLRCTAHFVLSVCMLFCYFRVVVVALPFVVVVVASVVVIELVCSLFLSV